MQLHQEFRRAWLEAARGADAWMAAATRIRLHAQVDLARAMRGEGPLPRVEGPASAHTVVADSPLARLLRYQPLPQEGGEGAEGAEGAEGGEGAEGVEGGEGVASRGAVVVVASLINRFYVLDLLPGISVLDVLRRRGLDVFVLDWKAPAGAGPELTFADYVDGAIPWAAREASAASGHGKSALLGYCMGGTMAAMAAARHPERFSSLILLGAPIDFHASGALASWTARGRFDADLVIDALGNMPPALMQSGFKLMKPWDAIGKMMRMHQEKDEQTLRHMVALEAWLEDNIAFPGGLYREYIGRLYQDNALIAGEMKVGGTPVDLGRIAMPLLVVTAKRDHICAPPSSLALLDRVASKDQRSLEFDTGHIGMTASRRAIDKLWPEIAGWMLERTG